MSSGNPYDREQLKKELIEMLVEKQAAIIKEIEPEIDLDDICEHEGCGVHSMKR